MSDSSVLSEMEMDLDYLPVNQHNFPAKLWWMINSPDTNSIRWDSSGETVIVNKPLFEAEFFSPAAKNPGMSLDLFKTTNYKSFIRQLNLYGFRKVAVDADNSNKQCDYKPATGSAIHQFQNPNFKEGHPELLANLKRLTSNNKAKMEAGIEVPCRPPTHFHHFMVKSFKGSPTNHQTPERQVKGASTLSHRFGYQQQKPYDRTPVPPHTWTMGHGSVSPPTHFYSDKGVPLSMIYSLPMDIPYMVPSGFTIIPQGPQSTAGPFLHHHPHYMPGFYTEVLPRSIPSFMDPNMAGSHQPAASYSRYGYYPNYTFGYFHPSSYNPNWLSYGSSESKASDVNLDTVFRMVDELQSPFTQSMHSVKVSSPDHRPCTSTAETWPTSPSYFRSPVRYSQPKPVKSAVLESSLKTAAVSVADIFGDGDRKRASDTTTGTLWPHPKRRFI